MHLFYRTTLLFFIFLLASSLYAQENGRHNIRLSVAQQASFFSPHEDDFPDHDRRYSNFSFGVEALRMINSKLDISLGYYYANQLGNTETFDCLVARDNSCPTRRGKIQLIKMPLGLGWYIIQTDKFRSRLGLASQFQLNFSRIYIGRPDYKKFSLGLAGEWGNYFHLKNNIDFYLGLRYDRSLSKVDESRGKSHFSSLGLQLGLSHDL
ncbi:MAG: hypothetical protein AAF696_29790 [Bacteroidota bacterium]